MTEILGEPCASATPSSPEDVVELSLLLPADQAAVLEAIAFERGVTAGEMVRRLVRDFLAAQKVGKSSVPWMFRDHIGSSKGH
jgi:hypothetical protein